MRQTGRVMHGFGWSIELGGGFACWLVPVLRRLVANKAEDATDDVGNYQLIGLRIDQSLAGSGDIIEEGIDVMPL